MTLGGSRKRLKKEHIKGVVEAMTVASAAIHGPRKLLELHEAHLLQLFPNKVS